MYLKSLVLKGFKSFADRSVLSLEPGMTVVVGPNGSGKSNISDAVLWVLGEQSAKQLRGQAMEDVIFAGSSARQAVSLAEVDLVLDNSDHTLALDFDEVVITRRMYRSGESEYLINGSPSRLMDVLDILNDSGLGRDTHSIISQGSLQGLLQARPEDRRLLIEEAAGILKHKKRKERSGRKLKSLDSELARVHDIAAEIDRQLKPLERQASRAQQYEQLADELKELQLTLAVDDLRLLQKEWESVVKREKEADSLVELARFRLEEKNRELEKYQRLLEEKGLFVGDLAEQRRRCQSVLERLDASMLLIEEKGRNMVNRLSELRQTIHRSDSRIARVRELLEQHGAEQRDTAAQRDELEGQLEELQGVAADVAARRKEADGQLAAANAALRACTKAVDDVQLQMLKVNESLSTADVQDEMLVRRNQQIDESFNAMQTTLGSRRGRLDELEVQISKLQKDSVDAKADIDRRVRLVDDARAALDGERDALYAIRAEVQALEEVDRAFDEADPMHAWIASHKEDIDGIVGPLSELLSAPSELEELVEHLLGDDISGLAMEDAASAGQLIDRLLAQVRSGGDVSLLPLDSLPAPRTGRAKAGERLLDLLDYDEANACVAEALLGDVYLVGSVAEAVKARRDDETGARFVTRDGVVAWPGGKMTVRTAKSSSDGVLGRKKRLAKLAEDEPRAARAVEKAESVLAENESNLQLAQADDFEISQNLAQLTGEADSLREEIGRLEATITGLMQERDEIAQRREKIVSESAAARGLRDDLEGKLATLEEERAGHEERLAVLSEQRAALYEQEGEQASGVSAVRVELATLREREQHLARQVSSLEDELEKLGQSLSVSRETERSLEVLRLRVEPLYDAFASLREGVTEKAELLRDQAQLEQAGQGDLRDTIEQARAAVADEQGRIDECSTALTDVRIEKSKLEVRVENAIKVITEENGVILDIALQIPEPEDRAGIEQQAARLSKRISRLGSVDPIAIEEYRKLKDRRDFIGIQLEDLEGARKALQRIVAAIDRKMRNRFLDTFEQVNENFEQIFAELFPGGRGYLELTDPSDPEETGVEVHAQPRGKAVRKQSLLSGGEQSLVALALLFATYRVRSTPFYILDEVEAALDDTNLRRMLSYLDSIRDQTQFILVSHQRRTMEMADLLYGVSMQSDGVSKLVSQRLDQAMRQGHATPAADVEEFSGAK